MLTRSLVRRAVPVSAALVLALGGCSADDPDGSADATPTVVESEVTEEEPTEEDVAESDSTEALDAYVAAAQEQIPAIMESMGDAAVAFSGIDILGDAPSTLEYVYYFAEEMDPVATSENMDAAVGALEETATTMVLPEMAANGIVDPKVRYTYLNADGSEIWSYLIEG